MTSLLTGVLVVLALVICALAVLSIRRRARWGERSLGPGRPGILRSLARRAGGGISFHQRRQSRRPNAYRGFESSHAVQRLDEPGDITATEEEGGTSSAPGNEQRRDQARTRARTAGPLLGLTVVALPSDADLPQQDVYYVQRNVVALARGLRPVGVERRAGALALSAVMSSELGRIDDVHEALIDGVESANRVVRSISGRDPDYSDMVTTLDIVYLAAGASRPTLHFAHIGNASIWLVRAANPGVKMISEPQTADNGSLLSAVGLSHDVVPQTGQVMVRPRDRIFLTSAGSQFCFSGRTVAAVLVGARRPLYACAAALAAAARSAGADESIMVIAAEVSDESVFVG